MSETGMRCPNCDRQNQADATFCDRCGSRLAPACANCGSELRPDSRFCSSCGTAVAEDSSTGETPAAPRQPGTDTPTTVGGGRYELGDFLGEGGMKRVYSARDTRLDREVAVALIRLDGISQDDLQRIEREARAMAKLGDHPHVVGVFDIGEEDGRPYIVSQLMTGGDAAGMIKDMGGGGLPLPQAAQIADDVCQALAHAHAHGIVHRDVKPSNVWLTTNNSALLGDFGLAVALDRTRITQAGLMMGTIAYMPPELATGGGHAAEPRSDLYSLGVMIYELATGRLPFEGATPEALLYQHVSATPVPPSTINRSLPRAFDSLVLRLLAKKVDDRPDSADDVRGAIADLVAASSEAPAPSGSVSLTSDSLLTSAQSVFVGRDDEITLLRSAYEETAAGHGKIVMLVGEPGIGKTRLTEELSTYADLRGATVIVGACFEGDVAPAYWPWVQVMRRYLKEAPPDEARAALGQGASEIWRIVSEVREVVPDLETPPELEPEEARFRLFDAMAGFIARASSEHPLVLVLDDLHWSDRPSLLMLEFLARQIRSANVLIVGTYRDVEIGRGHALSETLGVLLRESHASRVVLRGLDESTVARFLERMAGRPVSESLSEAVFRETEGNPFFVNETARLLIEEGRIDDESLTSGAWSLTVPQSVREVIGRRLNHLSGEVNDLLTLASVVGRGFEVEVLAAVADASEDAVVDLLEEAVKAKIIEEDPRERNTFRFSHALIKETLLDELTTLRRIRIHGRVADAIQSTHGGKIEPYLAELAYHSCEAATGACENAIDFSVRAAVQAMDQVAWEEAVDLMTRAKEVLEQSDTDDPLLECKVLLTLADAKFKAGENDAAAQLYTATADVARSAGLAREFALAAIGTSETAAMQMIAEKSAITDVLLEAERMLEGSDDPLLARVMSRRAVAGLYTSAVEGDSRDSQLSEIRALAKRATEIADRIGDAPTRLRTALDRFHLLAGPDDRREQHELADEIVDLAVQLGDRDAEAEGRMARLMCHASECNRAGFDDELARYTELSIEMRRPRYRMYAVSRAAAVATIEGRFDDARRLSDEALKIGTDAQEGEVAPLHMGQQFIIGWLSGDLSRAPALISFFEMLEQQAGGVYGIGGVIAFMQAASGDLEAARKRFAAVERAGFESAKDIGWPASMVALVWACEAVGSADAARKIYDQLLPYRSQLVYIGGVTNFLGSVEAALGVMAIQMGELDLAIDHLETAENMERSFGGRAFELMARARRIGALAQAGRVEEARGMAAETVAAMDDIGLARFRSYAADLLEA